jgi:glucokinase
MTVAALDIGGTHVSAARVDPTRASVERPVRIEYEPHADRQIIVGALLRATSSVAEPAVDAVGVSVPGPFDYDAGICTIRGVGKLDALFGLDLRHALAPAAAIAPEAVVFLNDAEAFLLGEAAHGAAAGHTRVVGITLGTGLGSAFVVGGSIVRAGAGVPPDGELHRLPFRGAPVEERVSARALRARTGGGRDVRELAVAARAGDAEARRAFDGYAADLVEFLEPSLRAFAPTCLVVGGSISRAWDLLGASLEAAYPGIDVRAAARRDEAALLGAAGYALSTSGRL